MNSALNSQKAQLIAGNPIIKLVKPCRIDDGILKINDQLESSLIQEFDKIKENLQITFFVPASGSGSRMFESLYDFLDSEGELKPGTYEAIEKLLNRFKDFAMYNLLPSHLKEQLKKGSVEIKELVKYLVNPEGLALGSLPKGLIPFHKYGKFIINPFQEHIVQGSKIAGDHANFHFTINREYEEKINRNFYILKEITGIDFNFSFSAQDKETHAYTFDKNGEAIKDNEGNYLMRPAGHGSLIKNLNEINADLIFIKNIDNIQHYTKAHESINTKKILGAKLIQFKTDVHKILESIDQNSSQTARLIDLLNQNYQLQIPASIVNNEAKMHAYFNRPIRLCGMVLNEGQIGGGPFWVEDHQNNMSKQIIEKSQISSKHTVNSSFLRATHFNPVEIICNVKNYKNEKFDLEKFTNPNHYFLVTKKHKNKQIRYIEKPGLWNGGMYDWLTLFYEISADCFSPVKSFTDLLEPLHLEKK